jgi:hypothetical protein
MGMQTQIPDWLTAKSGGSRFKRGSLVKHPKHGFCTIGGTVGDRISLHNLGGKRLCQNAKPRDIKLLTRTTIVFQTVCRNGIPPTAKAAGFSA